MLIVQNISFLADPVLNLTSSNNYTRKNKEFTLTCIVENAARLEGTIVFLRKFIAEPAMAFNQISSSEIEDCTYDSKPGYRVFCGRGNKKVLSTTKEYILVIESISDDDITTWQCKHVERDVCSNSFQIALVGKILAMFNIIKNPNCFTHACI